MARRAHLLAATAKARGLLDRVKPVAGALRRDGLRDFGETGRDQQRKILRKHRARLAESRFQLA